MKKTLTIVTPDALQTVVPKPTRTEIIEALTKLKCEQLRKEQAAQEEELERLSKECEALLLKYLKKNIGAMSPTVNLGFAYRESVSGASATFHLDKALPEPLASKLLKRAKLYSNRIFFTEQKVRRSIRENFTGTSAARIDALLNTPATRKALEDTLAAIE